MDFGAIVPGNTTVNSLLDSLTVPVNLLVNEFHRDTVLIPYKAELFSGSSNNFN